MKTMMGKKSKISDFVLIMETFVINMIYYLIISALYLIVVTFLPKMISYNYDFYLRTFNVLLWHIDIKFCFSLFNLNWQKCSLAFYKGENCFLKCLLWVSFRRILGLQLMAGSEILIRNIRLLHLDFRFFHQEKTNHNITITV